MSRLPSASLHCNSPAEGIVSLSIAILVSYRQRRVSARAAVSRTCVRRNLQPLLAPQRRVDADCECGYHGSEVSTTPPGRWRRRIPRWRALPPRRGRGGGHHRRSTAPGHRDITLVSAMDLLRVRLQLRRRTQIRLRVPAPPARHAVLRPSQVGGEKIPAPGETSYRNSLFLYGVTLGAGVFSPPSSASPRFSSTTT